MIQHLGGISEHDMFNTFNMGTGMVLVVAVIGEIAAGEERVVLC